MIGGVSLWEPLLGEKFNTYEKFFLCLNVVIALGGLVYAMMLVGQVMRAPTKARRRCRKSPWRCAKGPTPISTDSSASSAG